MNLEGRLGYRRYQRYFVDLGRLYQRKEMAVYTGLILSLFTIAFLGFFAIRPTLVTIATLFREIQDQKGIEQKLQAKIEALQEAQINYREVANSVPLANQALPQESSPGEVVYPLEVLAQRSNLTLNSLSFAPVPLYGKGPGPKTQTKTSFTGEIGFNLNARGNFVDVKTFLDSLESLRRIIQIDSFALTQTKTEETQVIALTLAGRAFYFPQETK